jgi:hypothetical protein
MKSFGFLLKAACSVLYFLVEVESVLALVRASECRLSHRFIFDEFFPDTNAVERIATAEAVLGVLIE